MFKTFVSWMKNYNSLKDCDGPLGPIDAEQPKKTPCPATDTPLRPKDEYTDWEPRHGDWSEKYLCHCGNIMSILSVGACTACGCKDRAENKVCRWEWEYSKSRGEDYAKRYYGFITQEVFDGATQRNRKLVIWTGCNHE